MRSGYSSRIFEIKRVPIPKCAKLVFKVVQRQGILSRRSQKSCKQGRLQERERGDPTTGKTEKVRKMGSKISLGAPIGQAINHDVINKYYTIKLIKFIFWNKNVYSV